jgi:hypothetical protein
MLDVEFLMRSNGAVGRGEQRLAMRVAGADSMKYLEIARVGAVEALRIPQIK